MFLIRFINRERNHSALFVEFKKKGVESVIKHNYGAKAQKEYICSGDHRNNPPNVFFIRVNTFSFFIREIKNNNID